jgi:hypothetical protein
MINHWTLRLCPSFSDTSRMAKRFRPVPPRMPFNMQMPYMGGLAQIISDGNRTEKAAFG